MIFVIKKIINHILKILNSTVEDYILYKDISILKKFTNFYFYTKFNYLSL